MLGGVQQASELACCFDSGQLWPDCDTAGNKKLCPMINGPVAPIPIQPRAGFRAPRRRARNRRKTIRRRARHSLCQHNRPVLDGRRAGVDYLATTASRHRARISGDRIESPAPSARWNHWCVPPRSDWPRDGRPPPRTTEAIALRGDGAANRRMFPVLPLRTDTPTELGPTVEHRALHGASAAALVSLFAEARFSPHVMNE